MSWERALPGRGNWEWKARKFGNKAGWGEVSKRGVTDDGRGAAGKGVREPRWASQAGLCRTLLEA